MIYLKIYRVLGELNETSIPGAFYISKYLSICLSIKIGYILESKDFCEGYTLGPYFGFAYFDGPRISCIFGPCLDC